MPRTGGPEPELILPIAKVGPAPLNVLSPEYQAHQSAARRADAHNKVSGGLKSLHSSLNHYRDMRIRTGDGRYIHVLAFYGSGDGSTFGLAFALVPGSAANKLRVSPGVLSGPCVSAGVGDGESEFFPTIGGTTKHIYEDDADEITVPVSSNFGRVYMDIRTDPIVSEGYGEFYVSGLELERAEVKTASSLPNDHVAASCNSTTGTPTQGRAYKTIALIRRRTSDAPVEFIQISYGNWHLQTCEDGNITIHEPNYVNQTVNITQA
jgi:hypothetical protein